MKNKSQLFHLYDQAVTLYYESCLKSGIPHFIAEKSFAKFLMVAIILKDGKGNEVRVRHTEKFIFVKLNGIEYASKIDRIIRPRYRAKKLKYSSDISQSFPTNYFKMMTK
ncbi:MAG: hypothetical protein WCJ95_06155 [Mariniphaga sp.]